MKTAYYTFTTWSSGAMAAGFDGAVGRDRRTAMVRQTGRKTVAEEDKVIDLTVWRAPGLDLPEEEPEEPGRGGAFGWEAEALEELPAPRPRRSRRAMLTAELVSTLSVVAAAVAIIVRVLTF